MSAMMQFLRSEDGAVTVDWVVLTSGIVVLAMAAIYAVNGSVASSSNGLANQITAGIMPVTE